MFKNAGHEPHFLLRGLIVLHFLRRVLEGTGWVLDGFPASYNQAKMLEKALTGFDAAV